MLWNIQIQHSYNKMKIQNTPSQQSPTTQNPPPRPTLHELKQQLLTQTTQLLQTEIQNFEVYAQKMQGILKSIQKQIQSRNQATSEFQHQLRKLCLQIQNHEAKLKEQDQLDLTLDKIKDIQQKYVGVCRDRVQIANTLNIKNLCKIDIENRRSAANQIFRWILVAVYDEPECRYFWENFRKEVWRNDKGVDFVDKVGKSSTINVKIQQRVKTGFILQNYETILSAPELKPHRQQIDKIYKIIVKFDQACKLADQMKAQQARYNQLLLKKQEDIEQYTKWKARQNALQGRLDLNLRYINSLKILQSQLTPKIILYKDKIDKAQSVLQQLQQFSITGINWNKFGQSKLECECSVF